MTQDKHTPEWRAVEEETGKGDVSHLIREVNADPPETVARIVYSNDSEEYARLIAAAPDLLAACKFFMSSLEEHTLIRDITKDGEPDWALKMTDFVRQLQKAEAAIAKAEKEGESK